MSLKILFFGDVVGKIGRKAIKKTLPQLKKELKPDLVIANAENLAHGLGATKKTLTEMREAGVDLFTSGNHVWCKEEIKDVLADNQIPILRPANYPEGTAGRGEKIIKIGKYQLLVISLLGRVFIEEENISCPFKTVDKVLAKHEGEKLAGVIVDFHAEATSEKVALGWYLDGRVSAIIGTHTHVGTADQRLLLKGTAFLSDAGMTGARDSVIGLDRKEIINSFLTGEAFSHDLPETGWAIINSVLLTINPKNGRAVKIKRVDREIEIN